jgi:hypothetical protein
MMVTIHVAAVSYVIKSLATPSTLTGTLIWVPATISVAVLVSWPIGRAIASAFDASEQGINPTCPSCKRGELRPLTRPDRDIFQPVTACRCALCKTTFRDEGGTWIEEPPSPEAAPANPPEIAYLSDPLAEAEMRFLDEEPGKS